MPFDDRRDAGCKLASALAKYKDQQPVVLALPRGGVPVAAEVAVSLNAPLDLVLVRKIGVPFQPIGLRQKGLSTTTQSAVRPPAEATASTVVEDTKVIGIVSIGDLLNYIISKKEFVIDQLEHYIQGRAC